MIKIKKTIPLAILTFCICLVAKSENISSDTYMNHMKCIYSKTCNHKDESLKRAHEITIKQHKSDLEDARRTICLLANGNFSNWKEYCDL